MPDENPLNLEIILNWTLTHTFVDPASGAAYFYTRIIEAYFLAERLGMPEVCHAIMTEIHDRAPRQLMDCHGFIYTNTIPASPLRHMLVSMVVNDERVEGVFQKGPDYGEHSKFLSDHHSLFTSGSWTLIHRSTFISSIESLILESLTDQDFVIDLKNELVEKLRSIRRPQGNIE